MTGGRPFDPARGPARLATSLAAVLLRDFDLRREGGVVVGVGGESGSGKSVTATGLARELDAAGVRAVVIHQDDYFHRPPGANHDHRTRDLRNVGPHEVNLELVSQHIRDFRHKRDVTAPRVDYPSDSFLQRRLDFASRDALIVEGTYVLGLDDIDVRIFLEATHEETRDRRRARNRDVDAPVIDQILALEHRIIAPLARDAHIVIDRDFEIAVRT